MNDRGLGTEDRAKVSRIIAALLVLTLLYLALPVFLYWTHPDERSVAFLVSSIIDVAAGWLTLLWFLKIVSPFLMSVTKSATVQAAPKPSVPVKQGPVSRWMLGLGAPLAIVSLLVISGLVSSMGWGVAFWGVVFLTVLVGLLWHYSFFTGPVGTEKERQQDEAGDLSPEERDMVKTKD